MVLTILSNRVAKLSLQLIVELYLLNRSKIAQNQNIDVIVLDHHQSDLKLPDACAIVNPNRYDDTSQLNYLCAAGVCFMFFGGFK